MGFAMFEGDRHSSETLADPLSYGVDALRGMLIGTYSHVLLDFGMMGFAAILGIVTASPVVGRQAR